MDVHGVSGTHWITPETFDPPEEIEENLEPLEEDSDYIDSVETEVEEVVLEDTTTPVEEEHLVDLYI